MHSTLKRIITDKLIDLEQHLHGDVLSYYGVINDNIVSDFLRIVESLADDNKKDKLFVILTTGGGSATAVERFVHIIRKHYLEVVFIVPDYAYSAGTIFCMSGDDIYMDYHSVLGPIDPQVINKEGKWVPALGYLDKVNELIDKASADTLSNAEFLILKDFDLAELKGYEQAKELTITLLKDWLVKYKFKNWNNHKDSTIVSNAEKVARAEEIATSLSNNQKWKSHGRPIHIDVLEDLKLNIHDYSDEKETRDKIIAYHRLLANYLIETNINIFINTRKNI
jgi:hypothetical protein